MYNRCIVFLLIFTIKEDYKLRDHGIYAAPARNKRRADVQVAGQTVGGRAPVRRVKARRAKIERVSRREQVRSVRHDHRGYDRGPMNVPHFSNVLDQFFLFSDLSKNCFTRFPAEVTAFWSLESLNLHHNAIRSVPNTVTSLQSLVHLDLRFVLPCAVVRKRIRSPRYCSIAFKITVLGTSQSLLSV